jgi:hypothetical protein
VKGCLTARRILEVLLTTVACLNNLRGLRRNSATSSGNRSTGKTFSAISIYWRWIDRMYATNASILRFTFASLPGVNSFPEGTKLGLVCVPGPFRDHQRQWQLEQYTK